MAVAAPPPSSLWSRKRDLAYFAFFVIHAPIIFRAYRSRVISSSDPVANGCQ